MKHVGTAHARPDAYGKVTGAARYPADLSEPGMLHLGTVFAHRAHARIRSIDTAAALAAPGVTAVFTAADVPHNRYGLIERDQPVMCDEIVRYSGDRVALVAAQTHAAAVHAATLVRVEYDDLPRVTDPREAMRAGTPRVHAERDNLLHHQRIRKGDTAAAFAAADVVLTGRFATSWQEHAYLQPDAGIAFIDDEGRLVIETAGQWLHEDRRQVAEILGLSEDRVVVRYAAIGGAFGGREDLSVQALLAVATWTLQRPTAIRWSREETILGHNKRHPFYIDATWGARRDGTVTAVETTLVADGGAYASTSAEVLKCATLFAQGPYEIANITSDGYVCYTNNVPSGAFRGFGVPQPHFAAESMITRIAHALALDPVDVRRKNLLREGSIEPTQNVIPPGVSARATLERCVTEMNERFATPAAADRGATQRRGTGIASAIKNVGYSFGYPEQATATVELFGAPVVTHACVRTGVADLGQGGHLAMLQIAAEALALPLEALELIATDSSQAPNAGSASASRLTWVAGRAVERACEAALAKHRRGEAAVATIQHIPPRSTPLDAATGAGTPNGCYGYAAQAVEVDVDLETGVVRVLRIISVHDVGRAINPQQVEAQIEGCLAQAIGYALSERFQISDGTVTTPHLSSYFVPTARDVPLEIYPVILELADPHGPFGARGMAEMPLVPFAAAVAAAIHDATGVWLCELPMTPERVLAALVAHRAAGDPPVVSLR
jgi:CO/xanthine dehydrogenase Mo-binding subunit